MPIKQKQKQQEGYVYFGAIDGTLRAAQAILKTELITLSDSANSTPAPADRDRIEILPIGGQSWDAWDTAGGQFQTEGQGATNIPALGSMLGANNKKITLIYESSTDTWHFHV